MPKVFAHLLLSVVMFLSRGTDPNSVMLCILGLWSIIGYRDKVTHVSNRWMFSVSVPTPSFRRWRKACNLLESSPVAQRHLHILNQTDSCLIKCQCHYSPMRIRQSPQPSQRQSLKEKMKECNIYDHVWWWTRGKHRLMHELGFGWSNTEIVMGKWISLALMRRLHTIARSTEPDGAFRTRNTFRQSTKVVAMV